jgi:tetratricopeptide (TPR) repeat protein
LVLAERGNFSDATQHLRRAAELERASPAAAYPHFLLGRILTQQTKYQEALVELDTACKLKLNYGEAYLAIGVIKRKLVDDAGAVKALEKAVAALPNNVTAQQALGEEDFRLGNYAGAAEHLQKARDLAPDDRSLLYQLCQALRKAGRIPESKTCEQRLLVMVHEELVLNDQSSAATATNNQGVELEKGGDLEGALAKYREAARLNPAQTVFRRNLGLALCRLGRWQEGITELREVLKMNPNDADATQALYVALDNVN